MTSEDAGAAPGVTFEVIVHRIKDPPPGFADFWVVRVYAGDEHVHSAEGGVALSVGLREAQDAMAAWVIAKCEP